MNRLLNVLFVMVLLSGTVAADIVLRDTSTQERIEDVVVTLIQTDQTIQRYIPINGTLEDDTLGATIIVDEKTTPGPDYYGTVTPETTLVYPIGFVRGSVTDKLGNVVDSASLDITCAQQTDLSYPKSTDTFGSFTAYVHVGSCTLAARFQDTLGTQQITIEQGSVEQVTLELDTTIISMQRRNPWPYVLLAALLVGVLILLHTRKRKPVVKTQRKHTITKQMDAPKKKIELEARGKSIYQTLAPKEKAVVDFLCTQNDGASIQSKIRQATGLPKSSLFRIIESLEQKQVIITEKTGKARKIYLSEWFLS